MEEKKKMHASGNRTGANNRAMTVKSVKSVEKRRAAGTNAAALHTVRAPRVVNVKKQDKTPFPWSVIVTAVIFTALLSLPKAPLAWTAALKRLCIKAVNPTCLASAPSQKAR